MIRSIEEIKNIQMQKAKEISSKPVPPLNDETKALAEHKRFTFDIINTPVDPLR